VHARGDLAQAQQLYEQALDTLRDMHAMPDVALMLTGLSAVAFVIRWRKP